MKEIRDYIKAQIRKIDASISEYESEMSFDELPASRVNNSYLLSFGDFENTQSNTNYFEDTVDVEINLYRSIERRVPGAYDRCVDLAKRIRSVLVHPKNLEGTVVSSILPSILGVAEYEKNRDIYEIKLNLTFTVSNSL